MKMNSAEKIKRLFAKSGLTVNSKVDDRIIGNALTALDKSEKMKSLSAEPNIWRIIMKNRMTKLAAAAIIIIVVIIGIDQFGGDRSTALAQVLEQIEKAMTITWKITFYNQVTSKDGKRTWIETKTRKQAYKAPGLYRDVHFDENDQIHHWTITDTINMRELSVNPGKKRATVRELAVTTDSSRGPFVWVNEQMNKRNLEWVGKKETATGEVNIFRTAFWSEPSNKPWSYDFWIDVKTKQLVALYVPGADIYDPEKDPTRENPTEEEWSMMKSMCSVKHDINFDVVLEDSLFSLEPPEGYTVQSEHRAQVTEKDMVEYLGIMADYNNKTFPDQVFPFAFTSDRLNKIYNKAKNDRTAAERKLLNTMDHYKMASLNMMPTGHFVEDHTEKDSFRYLGKGVKLGDKDRIICWYKLKGLSTYRAVYGDLSVKDVAPEDLPLRVEP